MTKKSLFLKKMFNKKEKKRKKINNLQQKR